MSNLNDSKTLESGSEPDSTLESPTDDTPLTQASSSRLTLKNMWEAYLAYGNAHRTGGPVALVSHMVSIYLFGSTLFFYLSIESTPFKPLAAIMITIAIAVYVKLLVSTALSMWKRPRERMEDTKDTSQMT